MVNLQSERSSLAVLVRRMASFTSFGPSTEVDPLEAKHRADRERGVEDDGGIALQLHRSEGCEHHGVEGDRCEQDSARRADLLPTETKHAPLDLSLIHI